MTDIFGIPIPALLGQLLLGLRDREAVALRGGGGTLRRGRCRQLGRCHGILGRGNDVRHDLFRKRARIDQHRVEAAGLRDERHERPVASGERWHTTLDGIPLPGATLTIA